MRKKEQGPVGQGEQRIAKDLPLVRVAILEWSVLRSIDGLEM